MTDVAAPFRDVDDERVALGDALAHGAEKYVGAGYTDALFSDERNVSVWRGIAALHAMGVQPDVPAVRAWLRDQQSDVSDAYVMGLDDGVPRQSPENIQQRRDRLDRLARCRRWFYQTRRLETQLRDQPTLIDNGFLAHAAAQLDALQPEGALGPQLMDDVAVLTTPEPTYLVEGTIPAEALAVGYGESGIGKTFAFLDLGLSVASGREWLGRTVQRGPVVFVAAEGAPAPRIGAWKVAHGFSLSDRIGFYVWGNTVPLLEPTAVNRFIATVRPVQPVLVILDTLARCLVGGDENSARDVGLAVANADRIRRALHATVLFVHHANKGGSAERGSSALRGACDTMLQLAKVDDLLQLSCAKQKDAEPFSPIDLRIVPAWEGARSCVVRLASEVAPDSALTDAQSKALHALRELFGDLGAKSQEWEDGLKDMHRSTFFRARKVLVDRGYVRESQGKFFAVRQEPISTRLVASRTMSHSSRMRLETESQGVAL